MQRVIWINPSGTDFAGTSVSSFAQTLSDRAGLTFKGLEVWSVAPGEPYSMRVEVDAVAGAAAAAGLDRYHLFGFSAGGTVALAAALALGDAIRQWANLGALVDALHRADFALLSRALEDTIAEPRRASLVPGLAAIKRAAVDAGALGCSLSGSGPSLFALCRDGASAEAVAAAMTAEVSRQIGGEAQTYVSPIAPRGARVVSLAGPHGSTLRFRG